MTSGMCQKRKPGFLDPQAWHFFADVAVTALQSRQVVSAIVPFPV